MARRAIRQSTLLSREYDHAPSAEPGEQTGKRGDDGDQARDPSEREQRRGER